LNRYASLFNIFVVILAGILSLTQPVCAETLVESTADTRLTVAMRVDQAELQKLVPAPWQVSPIPAGPLQEANFLIIFIDTFLVQDAQGKPDKEGITRKVAFAVPAKPTQPVRWPS
jgi:hypothetical protein